MAWRECKGVVVACVACAGISTCCLWTFADGLSKDPVGPPLWIVGALVGIAVGAVAGLLACVLARPKGARELLAEPDPDGARIADEREVRVLRYLLGITLALLGAVICSVFLLDAIANAMPWRW